MEEFKEKYDIRWPKLTPGTLIRRYKRFMADVRLEDGSVVTAHCPNSGRMTTCSDQGHPVFLSYHDKASRKLKFGWELIRMPESMVGVNTLVPNRLVQLAAQNKKIEEFLPYDKVRREVRSGRHTRFDLQLTAGDLPPCFVEVKNCTLVKGKIAFFPDAVTTRGQAHLKELRRQVENGLSCFMFFVIQRMDAEILKPADDIDPEYGRQLRKAAEAGVGIIAFDVHLDLVGIRLRNRLPCIL
ncbi:MAG: DNA/RNA nuclease SfsA [Deltaproteobacteria bacterium]|nr:DNA/RNA nuclease SfsA [Deltaproteobacteria bacterium]